MRRTRLGPSAQTKAFLRALNKANEFVIKNPKAAGQLAAKALDMKADDVVSLLPKVKLYGKSEVLGLLTGGASGTANERLSGASRRRRLCRGLSRAPCGGAPMHERCVQLRD